MQPFFGFANISFLIHDEPKKSLKVTSSQLQTYFKICFYFLEITASLLRAQVETKLNEHHFHFTDTHRN